jgi:tetratricopeptide (TPR) repeat protein
LSGQDAAFVATSASGFRFGSIVAMQPRVADAGFWDPTDLLAGYVGDARELAPLAQAAAPYALSHPMRPALLARNLTDRTSPVALAALLQHRLAGPDSLLSRLLFESDNQRAIALRGFADIYGEHTRRILQGFALRNPRQQQELLAFFDGPLARLDLFAPKEDGRPAGIASALLAFGLRDRAVEVLTKAIQGGNDTFALRFRLGVTLEGMNRGGEALRQYQQALALQPDSVPAMGRMAALLLAMGRQAEAADVLRKMIGKQPTNVSALLMLAGLYAGPLKRPRDAADFAVRVLDIEPDNTAAQDILALCRQAGSAGAAK